jgi:RNA recognition motif-containing protein
MIVSGTLKMVLSSVRLPKVRMLIIGSCMKSTSKTLKFCQLSIAAIEGWVIFITGIHEEAQEEDLYEAFADFGDVKNIHLNLDRRTGFVKGYALVEYARRDEAEAAIHNMNGKELLTKLINVDWAFSSGPHKNRGHEAHM